MGGGGMGGGGMGSGGCWRWRHGGCGYGWWTTSITNNRMTSYKKDYGDHSICETTTKSCGQLPSNASSVSSSMSSSLSIYNNLYHNLFHATFQAAIVVKSLLNAYFQDQPPTTTNSKNDEESTSCMNNNMDEINTATTTNTTTNSSSIPLPNLPSSNILSSSSSRSMNFFESISRSWLPIPL